MELNEDHYKLIENGYERRNKTVDESYSLWRDKPFLKGVPEEEGKILSVILENEKLFLDIVPSSDDAKMVEIVNNAFSKLLEFDIVQIQPMLGPAGYLYYLKFELVNEEIRLQMDGKECAAKTRRILFQADKNAKGIGEEIFENIFREITIDLRNNAGTTLWESKSDDFSKLINQISDTIHKKTLRGGVDWILTSCEVAEELTGKSVPGEIIDLGKFNGKHRLIVDPLYPPNEILVGNNQKMINGYFYCPYVGWVESKDPPGRPSNSGLMRYAKRLLSPKPYGRIKLNG